MPWLGCSVGWSVVPYTKRVVGSISGQGIYLGFESDPQLGGMWEATDQCFSLMSMTPSLKSINISSSKN